MIALWLAVGVLAASDSSPPAPSPTPAGNGNHHWFWPGSKDDPIHEQIEREINNALATKTEAPSASKQPDAKPVESDADYWMQVSALLAQFNTHINAVTPVLPEILAAQSRIEQKKALVVLNRALQALQIIFMLEQDER